MRSVPRTSTGTARGGVRYAHRRGMTLLEVVLATTILAMIVSVLFGAIGFMLGRQRVEQQALGASEVANRLMLQYLDDFTALPPESLSVEHGRDRFRWTLERRGLRLEPAEPARRARTGTERTTSLLEKSDLVTIRVWLSEESGGSIAYTDAVPHDAVSRLVYPILAGRNPDSWANAQTKDEIVRYMRDKMGASSGPTMGSFGSGKAGAPPPRSRVPSGNTVSPPKPSGGKS